MRVDACSLASGERGQLRRRPRGWPVSRRSASTSAQSRCISQRATAMRDRPTRRGLGIGRALPITTVTVRPPAAINIRRVRGAAHWSATDASLAFLACLRHSRPPSSSHSGRTRDECCGPTFWDACLLRRPLQSRWPSGFCHADAATCRNSWELPQIADEFRLRGLQKYSGNSLQNPHIQALSALDRTQEVAGSSPASSIGSHCNGCMSRAAATSRHGAPASSASSTSAACCHAAGPTTGSSISRSRCTWPSSASGGSPGI
jgi:hypothetical protein